MAILTFLPSSTRTFLSGLYFGTVITFSGLPYFLAGQHVPLLQLEEQTNTQTQHTSTSRTSTTHLHPSIPILILSLTTILCSRLLIVWFNSGSTTLSRIKPRTPSQYGIFEHDGNIIGGFVQGVGMVVVKSEPGCVLVGLGEWVGRVLWSGWSRWNGSKFGDGGSDFSGDNRNGIEGTRWIVLGGSLGGLVFVLVDGVLKQRMQRRISTGKVTGTSTKVTAATSNWVRTLTMSAASVALLALAVGANSSIDLDTWSVLLRKSATIPSAIIATITQAFRAGLLIASAQLISLLLTNGTLGVSSVYPTIVGHFLRFFNHKRANPGYSSVIFATGVICSGVGAAFSSSFSFGHGSSPGVERELQYGVPDIGNGANKWLALTGGFLMIFGARFAGGCTSGHGISGCGTGSVSSWVTVTGMVVGVQCVRWLEVV